MSQRRSKNLFGCVEFRQGGALLFKQGHFVDRSPALLLELYPSAGIDKNGILALSFSNHFEHSHLPKLENYKHPVFGRCPHVLCAVRLAVPPPSGPHLQKIRQATAVPVELLFP